MSEVQHAGLIFYQVLDEKTAVENSSTIRLEQTHGLGEEEVVCISAGLKSLCKIRIPFIMIL